MVLPLKSSLKRALTSSNAPILPLLQVIKIVQKLTRIDQDEIQLYCGGHPSLNAESPIFSEESFDFEYPDYVETEISAKCGPSSPTATAYCGATRIHYASSFGKYSYVEVRAFFLPPLIF